MSSPDLVVGNQGLGLAGECQERRAAVQLYDHWRRGGWLARMRAKLKGDGTRLRLLAAPQARSKARSQRFAGLRVVPIDHIYGSVNPGRVNDFDASFRPLGSYTCDRWVHLAQVRSRGHILPPVSLIQAQGAYFVQDGHHRISIARALGEQNIEAYVTIL